MVAKWEIRDRLLLGYASPLILFFGLSVIVYIYSTKAIDTFNRSNEFRSIIINNDEIILRLCLVSRQVKGYLTIKQGDITEKTKTLDSLNRERRKYQADIQQTEVLIGKIPEKSQKKFNRMVELGNQSDQLAERTITAKDVAGKPSKQLSHVYLQDFQNIYQNFAELHASLKNELLSYTDESNKNTLNGLYFTSYISVGLLISYLALAVVISYIIIQQIVRLIRQIHFLSVKVSSQTATIATSGKQLSAIMIEQLATTDEVANTTKKITTTSAELIQAIGVIATISQETDQSASNSQIELIHVKELIQELSSAIALVSDKLEIINSKASGVNTIVEAITKIADQANLLSLNAALESDKAGEHGKGFAIIAQEIRRLADRTGVATLDIEKKVGEMQLAVSTCVMEMDEFTMQVKKGISDIDTISSKLGSIILQVKQLTPQFHEVSNSTAIQSQGTAQINQAITDLTATTSATINSLEIVNQAVSQFKNATQSLHQEISSFKVD